MTNSGEGPFTPAERTLVAIMIMMSVMGVLFSLGAIYYALFALDPGAPPPP